MLATGGAPWWGVAGSTLLGGVLAFVGTAFNERRKAKRENQTRWHLDVRTAARRYLVAATALTALVAEDYATFVAGNPSPQEKEMEDAKFDLLYVAPEPVLIAADKLFQAINNLTSELQMTELNYLTDARLGFINSIRAYLDQAPVGREFFVDL